MQAIIQPDHLTEWLGQIQTVADEATIHCEAEGAHVRAVDPAQVAMIDTTLTPDGFETWDVGGETLGVDLARLTDPVGLADSDELVTLSLDDEKRKLAARAASLDYTKGLIDQESIRAEPDLPDDLDLPCEVTVEARDLQRGVKAADLCSDHVRLYSEEGEAALHIRAEGDTDDVDVTIEREDCIDASFGPADSLFSLDYMKPIAKVADIDTEVTLRLGEEFPVRLEFGAAGGAIETEYMIAPRIQSG